jgi:predicted component of type VI protein secretion system
MKMARNTYPETFAEWRRLVKPLTTNNGDTPHLEGHRTRLEALMTQVEEIEKQQAALAAAKQEASQQLKALIAEGRKVAAFLKAGIRERYGRTAEKLVEYGLQPFRGNKSAKLEKPVEVKPPAPTPNA